MNKLAIEIAKRLDRYAMLYNTRADRPLNPKELQPIVDVVQEVLNESMERKVEVKSKIRDRLYPAKPNLTDRLARALKCKPGEVEKILTDFIEDSMPGRSLFGAEEDRWHIVHDAIVTALVRDRRK